MSEYIISDEQIASERRQAYEAGSRNRMVWTARAYHGEEIVRCRDCKYYMHSSWHRCDLHSIAHEVEPDGFCAWGTKTEFVTCKCGEDIERIDRIQTCPSCGRKVMA